MCSRMSRACAAPVVRSQLDGASGNLTVAQGATIQATGSATSDRLAADVPDRPLRGDGLRVGERPHDAGVRYELGRLCVDLGKPDLAASWYRAALACDPKHEAARIGLRALSPPTTRPGGARPMVGRLNP